MSLKQIKPEHRIIFLKKFIIELILNSAKEQETKKRIETEKLKQKLFSPVYLEKRFEKPVKPSIFQRPVYSIETRKPIFHRVPIPQKPMQKSIGKPIQEQKTEEVKPEPQPTPQGFALGKLEPFLKDKLIQSIECPGPEKNLLVKKYNKINVTRLILSQQEINQIIDRFSKQARIPITGGILKAAVGNLVLSAVISEFVGSRFIINKITPYSMIQK